MKKLLVVAISLFTTILSYGQCEKKVVLTASKTDHLHADSSLDRTQDENTIIEFDKSTISISPGDEHITGKVNSVTCNWTTPYKVGKTRLKVTITNEQGEPMEATITIEGRDGKITLLAEVDKMPEGKIRLVADKFEEKKEQ